MSFLNYYDKYGMPISMERWSQLLGDLEHKHVAKTHLHINGREYYLSTVWLGLDHSFSFGTHRPVIFETMAFLEVDNDYGLIGPAIDEIFDRYSTMEEAARGHKHWLRVLKKLARAQPKPKQLIHKGGKP